MPEPKTEIDEANSEADTNAATATAEQEEAEQGEEKQGEQPQKYIAAKDGEHRIPYEVLEAELAQNQRLQEELAASKPREGFRLSKIATKVFLSRL